jgi:haloalkane dehalogenase
MRARPFDVDATEYPFQSHWFERRGSAMHYVNEGQCIPIVMCHGNPTWSYLYRHIIKQHSSQYRCIAYDLPGFGFSDHPAGYGYTPQEHAE